MKYLYLIRHAKSKKDSKRANDFDRGLNCRGKKAVLKIAHALKTKKIMPDLILSSSAKRTKKTAKGLARKMGYKKRIIFLDDLYLAGPKTLLQIVQHIRKKHQTVFIVAHNPGITDFANQMMTDNTIKNIPTLGVAALQLPVQKWQECQHKIAKLEFFIYPKMYEK